nr:MoaD/ThiS family protein [uncultured Anaeromusa sp.]
MEGLIEVRFFMALSELVKKRQWNNPLRLALAEEIAGVELLAKLEVETAQVEAFMINGKAVLPGEARIRPGDRVALLPPGTPGPYRVMLGLRKMD